MASGTACVAGSSVLRTVRTVVFRVVHLFTIAAVNGPVSPGGKKRGATTMDAVGQSGEGGVGRIGTLEKNVAITLKEFAN